MFIKKVLYIIFEFYTFILKKQHILYYQWYFPQVKVSQKLSIQYI